MNEITAKINNKSAVLIKSTTPDKNLDSTLIAVNWFDTKIEWLYHLYNFLAGRSVFKVGGRPLFKGKIINDITGDTGKRRILLIVRYPNGNAFKKLLESTYFQIVSLLRMKAVKKFTFSFTEAVSELNTKIKKAHYCIHHFDSTIDINKIVKASKANSNELTISYAGSSFAYLYRKNADKEAKQIPSIIDNIIIYGSDNEESMIAYLKSVKYKELFTNGHFGYMGTLKRIF